MIKLLKKCGERCTGCGACRNICQFNAIKMVSDEEGFLVPVIDRSLCKNCGLCEKRCPVLNPVYKNDTPSCYAMMASDEIRKMSSSGGFFTVAARHILAKGGVVFGAAWKDGWKVGQVKATNEEELAALRGSKYVQGDSGLSFREAKAVLDDGKAVLYTGLPCQIAGLYAYLGEKQYDNLISMEVCCHGAPSPAVFEKYLKDEYGDRKIKRISFRDKKPFGWTASMCVYFEDGGEKLLKPSADLYYAGFLPCMIMRSSCEVCKFSRMPRQADITVGDFWGLPKINPRWDDRKGTSFVTVNNEKGRAFFDALRPEFKMLNETTLDDITYINKTMIHPFRANPGRKHFYSSLNLKPFGKLVEDSLKHHYDIGIVGYWYGINYGSVLTYYALYELLRELGKDPVFLPKPNKLWEERFNDSDTIAQKFIWKHCNVFLPYPTDGSYDLANEQCDDFIIGSDVVWNYKLNAPQVGTHFFMDWVRGGKRKIAYASSCGDNFYGDRDYNERALYHLERFDSISVREKVMQDIIAKELPGKEVTLVLDPVFLVNVATYEKTAAESTAEVKKPYIFSYLLRSSYAKAMHDVLENVRDGRPYYLCKNPVRVETQSLRKVFGDSMLENVSIEDWLFYMKNSEGYIGDSFHAMCFSLIFHKPFVIIYPFGRNKDEGPFSIMRFKNLLGLLGLSERLFTSYEDVDAIKAVLNKEIDWDQVEEKLDALRKSSRQWLVDALVKPPRTRSPEMFRCDELLKELMDSKHRVELLEKQDAKHVQDLEALHETQTHFEEQLRIQQLDRVREMEQFRAIHDQFREQCRADQNQLEEQIQQLRQERIQDLERIRELELIQEMQPWIIRKLKRCYRCYKENGVIYTIKRIGHKICNKVWLLRKFRGGVRCYRDNGFRYTIKHLGQKIRNRLK